MRWCGKEFKKKLTLSDTLKLGLYKAVSHIGAVAVVRLFQALDISFPKYTEEGYRLQDLLIVDVAQHKLPRRDEKLSEALQEKTCKKQVKMF